MSKYSPYQNNEVSLSVVTPQGEIEVITKNAITQDIIDLILEKDELSQIQTSELSKIFEPTYNGLKKLWRFTRENIQYKRDPRGTEKLKSPSVTWHYRNCSVTPDQNLCGADCKSFALFQASILRNMGLSYYYRFTSESHNSDPTHVYIVAILSNGRHVAIDSTPHMIFDYEFDYAYSKDYLIEAQRSLSSVNGSINSISNNSINIIETFTAISLLATAFFTIKKYAFD